MSFLRTSVIVAVAILLAWPLSLLSVEPANGWRGNGTGLWPEAKVPRDWGRVPHGAMEGMRNAAARPADESKADGEVVEKGLLRNWLILGPFPVKDSVAN